MERADRKDLTFVKSTWSSSIPIPRHVIIPRQILNWVRYKINKRKTKFLDNISWCKEKRPEKTSHLSMWSSSILIIITTIIIFRLDYWKVWLLETILLMHGEIVNVVTFILYHHNQFQYQSTNVLNDVSWCKKMRLIKVQPSLALSCRSITNLYWFSTISIIDHSP